MIAQPSPAHRKRVAPALIAALAAVCVLGVALPASASAAFTRIGQFSGPGNGADQLSAPAKGEVRLSDGRLLVADFGNDRIQVFAPTLSGATAETPLTDAALDDPHDVAIDQETGEVYVADADAIVRFTAAGVLDGTFTPLTLVGPIDFDESTDELVVGDRATSTIRRFSRTGLPGATFDGTDGSTALGTILDLAVDSTGEVVVVDSTGSLGLLTLGIATSTVERYSAAGAYEAEIGPVATAATVAIEPTTDRVLVGGNLADSYNLGAPLRVSAFDASGAAGETVDLPTDNGLQYSQVSGVAVGEPGGRMYAITDLDAQDRAWGAVSVQVYDNPASPAIASDPAVSDVTGSTAEVAAMVDPNGTAADWVLELSTDGGATWKQAAEGTTSTSTDPEQITASLANLDALTDYLVRLRLPNAGVTSTDVAFSTPAGPPLVRSQPAVQVSATGARLVGSVDPQAAETTYWFEYGTTTSYGNRIPVTPGAAVGDGNRWQVALQDLTGLQADTTYHFRLVAESENGTSNTGDRTFTTGEPTAPVDNCSNADIRAQQGSTHLSDCRAYEQVSPPQKYNGGVILGHRASNDGNAVAFMMNTPVNSGQGGFPVESFVAHRGAGAWTSESASLPMRGEDRGAGGGIATYGVGFTEDFSKAWVNTNDPVDPGDRHPFANGFSITDGWDIYLTDVRGRTAEWVSRADDGVTGTLPAGRVSSFAGGTPDGSHAVFGSARGLVSGVPDQPAGFYGRLYEAVGNEVRIVSVLPNGTNIEGQIANGVVASTGPRHNDAISEDGRRIYWNDNLHTATGHLYLREDGLVTKEVSKGQPAAFIGATPDGARAYIYSAVPIDGAPSGGLYRYDADADEAELVEALGGMVFDNEDYRPVVSDVGERVYFFANTQLAPGAGPGLNLYVWDDGDLGHVANVSETTETLDTRLRVTRDGRFAAFSSRTSLDPRHAEGKIGIYRYDLESDEVVCASCGDAGTVATGDARFRTNVHEYTMLMFPDNGTPRNVTDDGHVFFQAEDGLVPGDVNGKNDVYEFDGDRAKLISSGTGISGSEISDNSDDGSSVFFLTPDTLTGHDIDGGMPDFYAARVDGGFPEPPPSPERCRGDACQGGGGSEPRGGTLGTRQVTEDGNVRSGRKAARLAVTRRATVRGPRGALRVRVGAAGALSVRGAAVRGKRVAVPRAGSRRLVVALDAKARRALAREGRLRASIRVTFKARGGPATTRRVTVTFVRKGR